MINSLSARAAARISLSLVAGAAFYCLLCGVSVGSAGAQAQPSRDTAGVYFEYQVTEPVEIERWDPPSYPDSLKRKKIQGDVLISFVVDVSGAIEPKSVRIMRSTHPAFGKAVLATISSVHFRSAYRRGRPVRQHVQQQFIFGSKE